MTTVKIPLLPLRELIVFPHEVVPLFVGREKSIAALDEAMAGDRQILLCAQKKAKINDPRPDGIHSVGTIGSISTIVSDSTRGSSDTAPAVTPAPQPITSTSRGDSGTSVVRCPRRRWSRMSCDMLEAWTLPALW